MSLAIAEPTCAGCAHPMLAHDHRAMLLGRIVDLFRGPCRVVGCKCGGYKGRRKWCV